MSLTDSAPTLINRLKNIDGPFAPNSFSLNPTQHYPLQCFLWELLVLVRQSVYFSIQVIKGNWVFLSYFNINIWLTFHGKFNSQASRKNPMDPSHAHPTHQQFTNEHRPSSCIVVHFQVQWGRAETTLENWCRAGTKLHSSVYILICVVALFFLLKKNKIPPVHCGFNQRRCSLFVLFFPHACFFPANHILPLYTSVILGKVSNLNGL